MQLERDRDLALISTLVPFCPPLLTLHTSSYIVLCFVFVDLTLYCGIQCSNILTVGVTHKKHVHIVILSLLSFFLTLD